MLLIIFLALLKDAKIKSFGYLAELLFLILIIGCSGQKEHEHEPDVLPAENWPMAAGPNHNWSAKTTSNVPTVWSVSTGKNVKWKTELPEGGQSGIAVWGDKLFLAINKPLPEGTPVEQAEGTDIVGLCINANTGKIEWSVPITGLKTMPHSGLFSDNTSPTPTTDGKYVWFVNAGGMMACYDLQGNSIWSRPFESRGRHNAKQCEPILVDGQLLYVMVKDEGDAGRKTAKLPEGANRKSVPDPQMWPWTYIRSFDASTGKPLWIETSGTSIHNTPAIGYVNGGAVVFQGRGGGHQPPETPYGFGMSYIQGIKAGSPLWSYSHKNPFTYTVSHFDEQYAYGFADGSLLKFESTTGKLINKFPLFDSAIIFKWDSLKQKYEAHPDAPFEVITEKYKPIPTNHSTILVGKYYLFMTHEGHCIGRVDTETGKVEYLQVPVQVSRMENEEDLILWNDHIPSDASNSRGMKTAMDRRAQRDGWGHVTLGSPIAVNEYVFFSTMIGMTYVVNAQSEIFDGSALVAINDLGPAGKTWSLSSPSYANGKMYHRGLKYIVCIEK